MAGAIYVTRNTVFAATAGAKTVLKLVTPTTFSIQLHRITISTDGVTSSAVPATVDLFTSDETTAGTGAGSAVTTQIQGAPTAHGLTVTQNHSVEGTTYTVISSFFLPNYMGLVILDNPLDTEEQSPAGLADSIGIRINVTANVNVLCSLKWSKA